MSPPRPRVVPVPAAADPAWQALTRPALRPLFGPDDRVVRLGIATPDGLPVGLALAMAGPGDQWELASLYVLPLFRGRGVGRALVAAAAEAMAAQGRTEGHHFCTIDAADQGYARFLLATGWSRPTPRQVVCESTLDLADRTPWLVRARLPAGDRPEGDRIVPWHALPAAARAEIAELDLPAAVDPLRCAADCEPATSLALLRGETPVGWVITHRIGPDLLRWTCSFVREDLGADLQGAGRILPLWRAATLRQRAETDMTRFIWTVPVTLPRMARFAVRRMRPWLSRLSYACHAVHRA